MNKSKLGPHGIIVELHVEKERKLDSGIIIPQTLKVAKPKGKVLATGSGTPDKLMEVRVGDIVTYQSVSARKVEYEGKECLLIDMDNCLWIDS